MKINTKKFQEQLRKQNVACTNTQDFEFGLPKGAQNETDIKWLFNGLCNDVQMGMLVSFLTDKKLYSSIDKVIFPTDDTIGLHIKGHKDNDYLQIKSKK